MNKIKKSKTLTINPFSEGCISWRIWEKNNNPASDQFWKNMFSKNITDRDAKMVEGVIDVQS